MRSVMVLAALLLASCASRPLGQEDIEDVPLKAVRHVDLDRYMGRWYMIANIPYFAERGNLEAHVDYSKRSDGMIDDILTARSSFKRKPFTRNGLIWITDTSTNASGSVTFLVPLWQDFSILYLDDDYRYTVVGHPSRNFCWIFAREPRMSDEVYQHALAVLRENLFDVSRVLKIPQTPDQMGAPGFQ